MVVNNVRVYGLEESIKRAKYPMATDISKLNSELTKGIMALSNSGRGEGHDQWLTGVIVQFDLTFTVKAWTEMQRYHFIDFVSSQSTMHRIARFNLDESYNEYVDSRIISILKDKVERYNRLVAMKPEVDIPEYNQEIKDAYLEILYNNPCGFKLTAGMTTNYRQLKTIYHQRKTHRLPEWREFCAWIETLPMFRELCLDGDSRGG